MTPNHPTTTPADRLLLRLARITLVLLYCTVLAGAVVRATGAGMGCPDWPRCFGRLIPPTDISQLPADYKEIFKKENESVADFNPIHTWIEYINRLCGAISGIFMFATALASRYATTRDRLLQPLLLSSLLLFGVVSWMGKVVVATNLQPAAITLHMVGALALVGAGVVAVVRIRRDAGVAETQALSPGRRALVWAGLAAVLFQILLGTQVREQIDHIADTVGECCRDRWVEHLGPLFFWHKVSAWSLVALMTGLFISLTPCARELTPDFRRLRLAMLLLTVAAYVVGVVLTKFAMPHAMQPAHLFLAVLLFGVLTAMAAGSRRRAFPVASR